VKSEKKAAVIADSQYHAPTTWYSLSTSSGSTVTTNATEAGSFINAGATAYEIPVTPGQSFPSTQPQALYDYHAHAAIEELKAQLSQFAATQDELNAKFETVMAKLDLASDSKHDSLSQLMVKRFRGISALKSLHISPTDDGYTIILTYPESMSLLEFLKEVVPAEIDMDRRFKEVYFDFKHIPESEFSIRSFPNAKPIPLGN